MAITASYSSTLRKLTVLGDALANSMIIDRDVAGLLRVNAGAVPVSGGPATIANTDLIEVLGLDLDDIVTLDETNGPLPAASISGGNGNDTLTGGSAGDTLNGDVGIDTLLGRGGGDTLNGGADGDTLTGGAGNDTMNGDAGNDRMIWNPGDGSDVMEGGADTDIAEVNGDSGDETFTIAPNLAGTRVAFNRTSAAAFVLDIGTTENLVLNANGGNDTITATGNLSALIALTIDGGAGNDTINAGNGADTILGGDGNDFIDGNQGADVALMGAGNDVFQWDPGDASDVVEGQADVDELRFNGSNASENIAVTPNGSRVSFTRDVAAINMDLNGIETITYNAFAGADNILLNDMTGTGLVNFIVDLGASTGGGDGAADRLTLNGSNAVDTIVATASGVDFGVSGLATGVLVRDPEAIDRLVLSGLGGDDVINVSGLAVGQIVTDLQGGLGNDVFVGSGGADIVTGGDGNDTALMGGGDDVFIWNPGDDNDTIEGQTGTDRMEFNGNGAAEAITISANGGRTLFFRDVAAVTMDLNDVEQITFNAGAGADSVTINDLTGTDVTLVTLNLAGTIGGTVADGAVDTIIARGSAGIDTITLSGTTSVSATGLPYSLAINQADFTDILSVQAGSAADIINASAVAAGLLALTLNGEAGNDVITGSAGADTLLGGTENDTLTGGPGADSMFGENGNDTLIWNNGDGSDVMEGGAGSDAVQVNGGSGAENFTIAANGTRVAFNRIDPAPFVLDIGTVESLTLSAGDGDDTISTSGNIAALIALTVDGGAGNDTILGGNGGDVLIGSDGNDFVDGNQANDIAFLGAGTDIFQWDPGDGSDTVEGQADTDSLVFNGNGANEIFTISPNGGRATLNRDVGAVTMDLNDVEQIVINAGAGTDTINVNNLTGTEVTQITVNLAGTIGGSAADAAFDQIVGVATSADNLINLVGAGSSYFVTGLSALISVNQSEATDSLVVQAGGGNDTILGGGMGAGVVAVTLDGGTGNDVIEGTSGADTLLGGDGDDIVDGNFGGDTAFLGIGNDVFEWDPGDGSDVVEGQAGTDELLFNGSNASEIVTVSANGGRSLFTRDVAAVAMDMDDVETITFKAFGGADNITINNLAGTDVTKVVLDLAGAGGGADGQADTITVNCTALGDTITITTTSPGVITITGLGAVIEIRNFEGIDKLVLNTGSGNDTVNAAGLDVGIAFVCDTGDGDDIVTGGDGDDIFALGIGNNSFFASGGNDLVTSTGQVSIFG